MSATWTGSEVVVWGGSGTGRLNNGGRYNPSSDTWTATSTTGAPAKRRYHSAVWTGTRLVVWGGTDRISNVNVFLDTGGAYDPVEDVWTPTSTVGAPSQRYRHAAVWTGTRMVIWGGLGASSDYLGTGGIYDPQTNTWGPVTDAGAPSARRSDGIWTGSRMIIWGGQIGDVQYAATGGRYDPVSDTWTPTAYSNAPVLDRPRFRSGPETS
jgi:hypothetical protein